MNVFIFSKDPRLFCKDAPGENARQRHLTYAKELQHVYGENSKLIIFTLSKPGMHVEKNKNLILIPTNTYFRPLYGANLLLRFIKLKRHLPKPDLISFQTAWEEGLVALFLGKVFQIPLAGQLHMRLFSQAWLRENPLNHIKIRIARFVLKRCERVRVVSKLLRKDLVANNVTTYEKIDIVPVISPESTQHIIESSVIKENFPQIHQILSTKKNILYVGRLSEEKNLFLWLRICALVNRARPDVHFILVGEGPLKARLRKYSKTLGIENLVHFLGEIPQSDLSAFYSHSSVKLFTSFHEGFGRVIKESFEFKLPVVATLEADPDEIILHGETGFVETREKEEVLAEHCIKFIDNPGFRDLAGETGQKRVRSLYNTKKILSSLIEHWKDTTLPPLPSKQIYYIANMRVPSERAHGYQIFQNCQSFLNHDLPTTLIVPTRHNPDLKNENPRDYYGLIKTPKIVFVPTLDLYFLTRNEKIQTFLNVIHSATFIVSSFFWLIKNAKKDAIIYYRDILIGGVVAHLFALPIFKLKSMYFLFECHYFPPQKWKKLIYKRLMQHTNAIVTVTRNLLQEVNDFLPLNCARTFSPDGFDPHIFNTSIPTTEARQLLSLPNDKIILGFIGKFHTNGMQKGIPEIIAACKDLNIKDHNYLFLFVGGPIQFEAGYRKQIGMLGLDQESFIFLEKQPIEKVPYFLKACDILLMPHPDNFFYRSQVSPLKLFEYLSAEKPIIASDLPSIREILVHERNSILVKPGDSKAIALAITQIVNGKNISDQISKNAKKESLKYTWDQRASKIINFVNSRPENQSSFEQRLH